MRKLLTYIAIIFIVNGHSFADPTHKIVAVKNIDIRPFDDAIKGFRTVCHTSFEPILLSKYDMADIHEKFKSNRPDLLLSIGTDSLSKIKGIRDTPIVYLMVLNPLSVLDHDTNITGVSINIPQEKQLSIFLKAIPQVRRIGLVYNPNQVGNFVKEAHIAAEKFGVTLISKQVDHSNEVPEKIIEMEKIIDAYWMMPDVSVLKPETIKFLLYFSFKNKIPILTFSEKYVKMGALISIGMDPFDIGIQAGELAEKILSGKDIRSIPQVEARKAIITMNMKIAGKFGISIKKSLFPHAIMIE